MKLKLVWFISAFVFLLMSCSDDNNKQKYPYPEGKVIKTFFLSKDLNSLEQDVYGLIDDEEKMIVLPCEEWLNDFENLVPSVSLATDVVELNVDGLIQHSDITSNDFTEGKLRYTVVFDDHSTIDYKVILITPQTTGLPVFKIDIEDGLEVVEKSKEYLKANFQLINPDFPDYELSATTGIRGRGNTTWGYPKKPYRIKFDKKTSLFGLGAEKSWVLLANYLDPTLLMTSVAFELGNRFELEYTNHNYNVELFLNGKYQGNYVLTEQVQVNKNRVNIDKKEGFFIEMDAHFDEEFQFKTEILKLPIMLKSPKVNTKEEMSFMKSYVQDFENSLFDESGTNSYSDYIDVSSLINFMLVNEITGNGELHHPKSTFAYKDVGEKMHFGPLWDFDWAFGKYGVDDGKDFNYFSNPYLMLFTPNALSDSPGEMFFCEFLKDPSFRALYRERWNELYSLGLLDLSDFLSQEAKLLHYSQYLNFSKWRNGKIYKNEIAQMQEWLAKHIEHINNEINSWD